MKKLRVLVACEMSARIRIQFAKRGWDAWSADLLPDEAPIWNDWGELGGHHYEGDVLDIIREDWNLFIAHPPCDHLSQAGARYWKQKQADGRQREAVLFFCKMLSMPRPEAFVVVENPVGYMNKVIGPPDQIVEPWMFGDPLAKKTCLWYSYAKLPDRYERLPDLKATHALADYPGGVGRTVTGGGSWRTDQSHGKAGMNNWEDSQGRARRHILRSLTPAGFARAAAEQWGGYIESLHLTS